jgi:hypothetical protein
MGGAPHELSALVPIPASGVYFAGRVRVILRLEMDRRRPNCK